MNQIGLTRKRRQFLALLFASGVGVGLVIARVILTRRFQHLYLPWNLLLAWVPWIATALLDRWDENPQAHRSKRMIAMAVWFFFFPNAPYILTDLVHLGPKYYGHYWVDMLLILLVAFTGLLLGFLSLQAMQQRVARRFHWPVGWLFVMGMSMLSGVGIYAGRFLRWNSWDVLARPGRVMDDGLLWVLYSFERPLSVVFPLLFGIVLFTTYLVVASISIVDNPRDARA
jgi:uncharacterized membrane protein